MFQIRTTKRVSMWPVGLCTKFGLSSPVVVNGTFVGFYDGWVAGRKFPVDMAGFAVSVEFLLRVTQAYILLFPISVCGTVLNLQVMKH
jgi:Glycosyltransferase family 43.